MRMRKALSFLLALALVVSLVGAITPKAEATTTITNINLTNFIDPVAGELPRATFFSSSGQHVYVSSTEWVEKGLGSFTTFKADTQYYVRFTLRAESGYTFPASESGVYVNLTRAGESNNLVDYKYITGDKLVVETYWIYAKNPESIRNIAVNGYKVPKIGEGPQYYGDLSVPSGYPYTISALNYISISDGSIVTSFETGKTYYARIELHANYGYTFPTQTASQFNSCTINGSTVLVDGEFGRSVDNGKTYYLLTTNFKPASTQYSVDLTGLVKPIDGEHPAALSVKSAANYTILDCTWYNFTNSTRMTSSDVFLSGKEYFVELTIKPKLGYVFPDKYSTMSVKIDGSSSELDNALCKVLDDGTLRLYTVNYPANKLLTEAAFTGFVKPVTGAHPSTLKLASSTANYTIADFHWYNKTDGKEMTSSDVFEDGKTYFAFLKVAPKTGYTFPAKVSDVTVTFDGSPAELDTDWCLVNNGTLWLDTVDYGAEAITTIEEVELEGFRLPMIGEHPVLVTAAADAPYTVQDVYWRASGGGAVLSETDVFLAGKTYYQSITLKPKSGYTFPAAFSDLTSVTFDGSDAYVDSAYCRVESDGTLKLFSLDLSALQLIENVEVSNLVPPVSGEHPAEMTVAEDAPYTISKFYWFDETDSVIMSSTSSFIAGHMYFTHVELTPKDGYVFPADFDDLSVVTFDGSSAAVDTPYCEVKTDGTLVLYSVSYKASAVITDVEVSNLVPPMPGEHPAEMTVASDAPYTISVFYWFNSTDSVNLTASDVFEAGKIYFTHVELAPKDGYRFPASFAGLTSVTFDGNSDMVDSFWSSVQSDGTLLLYSVDLEAAVKVTGVMLDQASLTLAETDTASLTPVIAPDNATDKTVVWSSTDETVATVDSTGTVTAVSAGTATIIVTTNDGAFTANCTVTVTHKLTAVAEVPATCTADGVEAYWKCEADGKLFSDAAGTNEISEPVTIPALGHNWGEWTVITPATESADGSREHTCARCGLKETEVIPKLTHTHTLTKTAAAAATCTAAGNSEYYTCSGCGKFFSDAAGTSEIAKDSWVLAALGHDWEAWHQTKAPTCTEAGALERACKRCGEKQTDTVPAAGHTPTKIAAAAATCTAAGNTEYYICSVCSKRFSDAACTAEVAEADTTLPALGHDWGKWTETKPATQTEDGEETRVCSRCGAKETRAIPKLAPLVNPFVDVKESDYFYTPVLWAYYHSPQITTGIDATHFGPGNGCTRGQVVTFLWRTMGCPEPSGSSCPFTDVAPGAYYYKAVLWAVEKGITNGLSATSFGPDATCTRGQIVTFLWRTMEKPEPSTTSSAFTDVAGDAYYYKPVLWAVENGVTNGLDAAHFGPDATCTRGQIVTFLYRAVNK